MGCSYEEYFFGDPQIAKAYRIAQRLKSEEFNQKAWWQGYYNHIATSSVLANIHFDNKHHDKVTYLDKPIEIFAEDKLREKTRSEEEREKAALVSKIQAWSKAWNAQHKQGVNNGITS